MKTIIYTKKGKAFSDFTAQEEVINFLNDPDCHILQTSTSNIVEFSRLEIKEKRFSFENIRFGMDNYEGFLFLDKDARFKEHPEGFCDWLNGILVRLLKS